MQKKTVACSQESIGICSTFLVTYLQWEKETEFLVKGKLFIYWWNIEFQRHRKAGFILQTLAREDD